MATATARRLILLLAALTALVLTAAAGVALTPAAHAAGAQNRVGAFIPGTQSLTRPAALESACTRPGLIASSAGMTAGFCVAAEDAGGLAQSFENPESLRGATAEEARSAIPEGYDGPFPLRKGVGERYFDPEAPGNAIYIEEGNPAASDPLHQGPYVRIANNGSVTRIPLQGNPTLP